MVSSHPTPFNSDVSYDFFENLKLSDWVLSVAEFTSSTQIQMALRCTQSTQKPYNLISTGIACRSKIDSMICTLKKKKKSLLTQHVHCFPCAGFQTLMTEASPKLDIINDLHFSGAIPGRRRH
jgi:hypothetical protein